jgi:hypothetical protein
MMKKKNQPIKICIPAFLFVIVLFTGCYKDKEELLYPGTRSDCDTVAAKFSKDILPIFQTYCAKANCHDAVSAQGGRTFTNYTGIYNAREIIKTRALIIKDMPQAPNPKLADSNINKINCWLLSGAPDN